MDTPYVQMYSMFISSVSKCNRHLGIDILNNQQNPHTGYMISAARVIMIKKKRGGGQTAVPDMPPL